ncbi:hypothetical protein BC834DRAFT_843747 [Gloeopeniophorella convolvens]|nr:hypothetical protein BC834DRAFT_843747 [Gloeopeniophorella convolvens]
MVCEKEMGAWRGRVWRRAVQAPALLNLSQLSRSNHTSRGRAPVPCLLELLFPGFPGIDCHRIGLPTHGPHPKLFLPFRTKPTRLKPEGRMAQLHSIFDPLESGQVGPLPPFSMASPQHPAKHPGCRDYFFGHHRRAVVKTSADPRAAAPTDELHFFSKLESSGNAVPHELAQRTAELAQREAELAQREVVVAERGREAERMLWEALRMAEWAREVLRDPSQTLGADTEVLRQARGGPTWGPLDATREMAKQNETFINPTDLMMVKERVETTTELRSGPEDSKGTTKWLQAGEYRKVAENTLGLSSTTGGSHTLSTKNCEIL